MRASGAHLGQRVNLAWSTPSTSLNNTDCEGFQWLGLRVCVNACIYAHQCMNVR